MTHSRTPSAAPQAPLAPGFAMLGRLIVPLLVWMAGMALYALTWALVDDRAIALIVAGIGLVSLAPLAVERRGPPSRQA